MKPYFSSDINLLTQEFIEITFRFLTWKLIPISATCYIREKPTTETFIDERNLNNEPTSVIFDHNYTQFAVKKCDHLCAVKFK